MKDGIQTAKELLAAANRLEHGARLRLRRKAPDILAGYIGAVEALGKVQRRAKRHEGLCQVAANDLLDTDKALAEFEKLFREEK